METDVLEQIINMISAGGEGAFWLAVLFIGKGYLSQLLTFTGVMVVAYLSYKAIHRVASSIQFHVELQRAIGAVADGNITRREKQEILELIHKARNS